MILKLLMIKMINQCQLDKTHLWKLTISNRNQLIKNNHKINNSKIMKFKIHKK